MTFIHYEAEEVILKVTRNHDLATEIEVQFESTERP